MCVCVCVCRQQGEKSLCVCVCLCRRLEWKNYEATVTSSKQIQVRNVLNDALEKLDFRDRIIKVALGFSNLVVATSCQCYIYR